MSPIISEHIYLFLQNMGFHGSYLKTLLAQKDIQLNLGDGGTLYLEELSDHLLVAMEIKLRDHEVLDKLQQLLESVHHMHHGAFDIQVGLVGHNRPVVAIQLPFDAVETASLEKAAHVAADLLHENVAREAYL